MNSCALEKIAPAINGLISRLGSQEKQIVALEQQVRTLQSARPNPRVLLVRGNDSSFLLDTLWELPFHLNVQVIHWGDELFPALLYNWDLVLWDLIDGFITKKRAGTWSSKERTAMYCYVHGGGAVLATHDTWDGGNSNSPLDLLGLKFDKPASMKIHSAVSVVQDHAVLHSYHDLGAWKGSPQAINMTHHTFSAADQSLPNSATVLSFDGQPDQHYLRVREVGLGRSAYWAAGHSSSSLHPNELLLLTNLVAWLCKLPRQ